MSFDSCMEDIREGYWEQIKSVQLSEPEGGLARLETIANLLEQIIEMNGEECVRHVLAGLPISKFSGPLVNAVMCPYKNLVKENGE